MLSLTLTRGRRLPRKPAARHRGGGREPHTQVSLEDAQKVRKSYKVGQRMVTPLKTKEFGRIAAQTAKHVIRQGLREGERNLQCSEMQSRAHELIAATVVSIDPERGNIVLDLGKGGSAVLPRNEQVPGETFTEGQTVQVYVVDVLATDRGPRVTISRTHPGLVKRMFELEVPEIYDGTVEVKAIAREAGARTKLAVWSKNPDVDPVGACIVPARPRGEDRAGAERREDRCHPLERGYCRVHLRRLSPAKSSRSSCCPARPRAAVLRFPTSS